MKRRNTGIGWSENDIWRLGGYGPPSGGSDSGTSEVICVDRGWRLIVSNFVWSSLFLFSPLYRQLLFRRILSL